MRITRWFLVAALLAAVFPASSAEFNPQSPGFGVNTMTGYFDMVGCGVGPNKTGVCNGGDLYLYTTNNPPEYPGPHCESDAVYPLGSGWESWSGSAGCEISNNTRSGPEGFDPYTYMSRGSTACQGFSITFGGSDSDVYLYLFPHIVGGNTGQRVKIGALNGQLWTEAAPIGSPSSDDVYPRFFINLSGKTKPSPSGKVYNVNVHLEGQATGNGWCAGGESYSYWEFTVTGSGSFSLAP